MNEAQFNRLALWQARAAQIEDKFERYFEALKLFGADENFEVWLDGVVTFVDCANDQTFGEAEGDEYGPRYFEDRHFSLSKYRHSL